MRTSRFKRKLLRIRISSCASIVAGIYTLIVFGGFFLGCNHTTEPTQSIPATLKSLQANVFTPNCIGAGCHSQTQPAALLSLDSSNAYQSLLDTIQNDAARPSYPCRVVPGKPDSSFLVAKITGHLTPVEGEQMPQRVKALPQYQIDAVIEWIKEGALNN